MNTAERIGHMPPPPQPAAYQQIVPNTEALAAALGGTLATGTAKVSPAVDEGPGPAAPRAASAPTASQGGSVGAAGPSSGVRVAGTYLLGRPAKLVRLGRDLVLSSNAVSAAGGDQQQHVQASQAAGASLQLLMNDMLQAASLEGGLVQKQQQEQQQLPGLPHLLQQLPPQAAQLMLQAFIGGGGTRGDRATAYMQPEISAGNSSARHGTHRPLTREELEAQFGYGLKEAAARLGVCSTTLKRACRCVAMGLPVS
jgi:hypothetical protein